MPYHHSNVQASDGFESLSIVIIIINNIVLVVEPLEVADKIADFNITISNRCDYHRKCEFNIIVPMDVAYKSLLSATWYYHSNCEFEITVPMDAVSIDITSNMLYYHHQKQK